jgi:hypothetical protein
MRGWAVPDWLVKPFETLFNALLSEYGPLFVLLAMGIIGIFSMYNKSMNRIIKAKDEEIERLVAERVPKHGTWATD